MIFILTLKLIPLCDLVGLWLYLLISKNEQ